METGPFIDDFPIKTSIYSGFSMAMLNNQMVLKTWCQDFCSSISPLSLEEIGLPFLDPIRPYNKQFFMRWPNTVLILNII